MRKSVAGLVLLALMTAGTMACTPPATRDTKETPAVAPALRTRTLTRQEVHDLLLGTSIQSTRNSNTAQMIKRADDLLDAGKEFEIVAPEDLPDDAWVVAAAGGVGGGGAWEYVTDRIKTQNLPRVEDARLESAKALSKHMGKEWVAIIRNEASGATLSAFESAISLGLPVVDACLAGRAKPELNLQVPFVHGISGTPAALVTRWGDVVILDKAVDDYRLEDLARAVAVSSGGGSSIARNPMTGEQVKRGTIRGAVSEAILFGKTVREALDQKQDPIAALVRAADAHQMFRGVVDKTNHRGDRGFDWDDVEIRGSGVYAGHRYRVFVKNENIMSWLDGKPDIMPPDMIYNLNPATGDAIESPRMGGYPIGMDVVIVGRAASPMWRTPKGIELFSPRHFGFDVDFVPIEDVLKTRPAFRTE